MQRPSKWTLITLSACLLGSGCGSLPTGQVNPERAERAISAAYGGSLVTQGIHPFAEARPIKMPSSRAGLAVSPETRESSQSAERRRSAMETMHQQAQEVEEVLLNFYTQEEELRARRSGEVAREEASAQVLRMADELVNKAFERLLRRAPERARYLAELSLWVGFPDRGGTSILVAELPLSHNRIAERLILLRALLKQGDEEYASWLTTELAKFHKFAQSAYAAGHQLQERAREFARKQAQSRVADRLAQTGRIELPPLLQKSRLFERFALTEYTEIPELTTKFPSFSPPRPLSPNISSRILQIWYETEGLAFQNGKTDRTQEFVTWVNGRGKG